MDRDRSGRGLSTTSTVLPMVYFVEEMLSNQGHQVIVPFVMCKNVVEIQKSHHSHFSHLNTLTGCLPWATHCCSYWGHSLILPESMQFTTRGRELSVSLSFTLLPQHCARTGARHGVRCSVEGSGSPFHDKCKPCSKNQT